MLSWRSASHAFKADDHRICGFGRELPVSAKFDIAAALALWTRDGRSLALGALVPTDCTQLATAFAGIDPWARYPYPADQLEAYFAGSTMDAPRFQILIGGVLAGAVGLKLDWLRGPYLQFLGLLPAYQNCGAGSLILEALDHAARQSQCRNVWVCASDFNAGALAFYERHGYAQVAALPDLVREGRTEVLLRRRVPPAR